MTADRGGLRRLAALLFDVVELPGVYRSSYTRNTLLVQRISGVLVMVCARAVTIVTMTKSICHRLARRVSEAVVAAFVWTATVLN